MVVKKTAKKPVKKSAKPVKKSEKHKVVIYSTHPCPWCKKTKEFLRANKISFTNKFVDTSKKNADEMIKVSGQQAVPVTVINGKVIVGYNESSLRKALGI
jgi:glutaredoxin-like YruB-family protein